ncbi:MAG: [FeFe] hydrogenase H-cluster maturation GTPase HydF [Epsilonproteobacteria bacterium]|nr:[FeFe] hydrogenase H-cluster maturation GTPase HydF [Campylobacterota bacterium]
MTQTPKGLRLHIGLFGRRNVGKSSLMNLITNQAMSIVSEMAGTTTDPVEKTMEIQPLGPVVFIDTAGIDDEGSLGEARIKQTLHVMQKIDIAILVVEPNVWGTFEEKLVALFKEKKIAFMIVCNKIDQETPQESFMQILLEKTPCCVKMSATIGENKEVFFERIQEIIPTSWIKQPSLLGDLINEGDVIVLVVPIDLQAPKGRLILPQVQAIRDILDHDACCIIAKERELSYMLSQLKSPPKLVVCDSQCVLKTVADTPKDVRVTTFSILMARLKGDLNALSEGARMIHNLQEGDKVLIAEACTHHALEDDIGSVKIPRWLRQYSGVHLVIDHCSGKDYPENIAEYKLVIHCGACTLNRQGMLSRLQEAQKAGVPITNYGIAISVLQGVLNRSLEPFPLALMAYDEKE